VLKRIAPARAGQEAPLPAILTGYLVWRKTAMRAKRLTLVQRREIFHALVTTQDMGLMTVAESRQHVTKQFEISDAQLRQIEDEGLEKEWPPLNEAVQKVG
jgi:hypothetical protein